MSDETIAEIKKKLADAGGLKLVAYGVDGIPTDEEGARKAFEWAKKMGIDVLVTETTPNDVIDKLGRRVQDSRWRCTTTRRPGRRTRC